MNLQSSSFTQHCCILLISNLTRMHTQLKNGNLIVFNSLLRMQRTALFSKKIYFLVFLGNQFDAKEQEQGNAATDFIFAALIMLNSSTQSY